ncbi:glycoprotein 3-alpha-L-fucosyltransferase A-like [Diadema antillarum]|uniref:glycoprotein 3-alpha-L-fucosyltransferase A-like n=1 Tax=Diadema antillarum TaxID=105358 RepID=UPI003A874C5C
MDLPTCRIPCLNKRYLIKIRSSFPIIVGIVCCMTLCILHFICVFQATHLQLDVAAHVREAKNIFLIRHSDVSFHDHDKRCNVTQPLPKPTLLTPCKGKLCFPETETFLKFQTRAFKRREKHPHLTKQKTDVQKSPDERLKVKVTQSVIIPSQKTNSTPFKKGSCYRQIHLWADQPRSFSFRTGDFKCPGVPCGLRLVVNTDMESLKSSDAVILFHRTVWDWAEMTKQRPRGQKWIFYSQESPKNTLKHVIPPMEYRNNSYDYIMSYRPDESHLYGSYGRYNPGIPELRFTDMANWVQNKTKTVAWMASNCNIVTWDRKGFVEELKKHIPISMYGSCGNTPCPRDERCNRKLRKHKFYLAFENSECRDYITEKLWRNAFLNDIVPVVYGPPREDYEKVLPPNSFIHVHDFKSVKELAEYLSKLDKDEGPEDLGKWWDGSCTSQETQYPIEI